MGNKRKKLNRTGWRKKTAKHMNNVMKHSKWLSKTFGDIGVDDPACQIVCEKHADPQFIRIIKSRHYQMVNDCFGCRELGEPGTSMTNKAKRGPKAEEKGFAEVEFVPVTGAPDEPGLSNKQTRIMPDDVAMKRARLDDTPSQVDDENASFEVIIKEEMIINEDPDLYEVELLPTTCEDIQIKQETPEAFMVTMTSATDCVDQSCVPIDTTVQSQESYDFDNEIKMEVDHVSEVTDNVDDTPILTEENLGTPRLVTEEATHVISHNTPDSKHHAADIADLQTINRMLKSLMDKKFISSAIVKNIKMATKSQCLPLEDDSTISLSVKMKSFAIILYVYSVNAYVHVRKHRNEVQFPPPSVVQDWLLTWHGYSGFTRETLQAINAKAKQYKSKSSKLFVSIDVKEVPIKMTTSLDPSPQPPLDWLAVNATSALILSAVALNADWKVPIGYFWTSGVAGVDRANLVTAAISILKKVGVEPIAITFDYNNSNVQMCSDLNCCIDKVNLNISFSSKSGKPIFLFPDPHGVLEGMYTEQFFSSFVDKYLRVVDLNQILLSVRKMHDVKEIKQALKKVIATELYKKDFSDLKTQSSEVTFFNHIHCVLDILFSRKGGLNLKKAVAKTTNVEMNATVVELQKLDKYFKDLRSKDPTQSLWETSVGRLILGLCALIESALMFIYQYSSQLPIEFGKFIGSTYFLANIAVKDQAGMNPTSSDIKRKYMTMIQDKGPLNWSVDKLGTIENLALLNNKSAVDRINLTTNLPNAKKLLHVVDDLWKLLKCRSTEFEEMFVVYIAQFVTYSLVSRLECETCIPALRSRPERSTVNYEKAIIITPLAVKFDEPSIDVLNICKTSEAAFQKAIRHSRGEALNPKFNISFLLIKVMKKYVGRPLFESIAYHQFNTDRTCNHLVELAKAVAELYLETRFQYVNQNMKKI